MQSGSASAVMAMSFSLFSPICASCRSEICTILYASKASGIPFEQTSTFAVTSAVFPQTSAHPSRLSAAAAAIAAIHRRVFFFINIPPEAKASAKGGFFHQLFAYTSQCSVSPSR